MSIRMTFQRLKNLTAIPCVSKPNLTNSSAFLHVPFFQDHVEATGSGENATVPEGRAQRFSCPVAGNPAPNITWYKGSELSGAPISNEKELEARENGCYTCLASNFLGTSVSITQCLIVGESVMFVRL